jgi:hypothetical protein
VLCPQAIAKRLSVRAGLLLLCKLALEMTLNFSTTKGVVCIGQYDRIDNFVALNLRGDKHPVRKFLIGKFHSSAICKCSNPLVVWRSGAHRRDDTPSSQDVEIFSLV